MKFLETCLSQAGNTRQIADTIYLEVAKSNEADLIAIDELKIDNLNDYDFIFLGSPIHVRGLAAPVKDLLDAIPDNSDFRMVSFITHASSAYSKEGFESGVQQLKDICRKKEIAYLGCFDWQNRLTPEIHDMVQQAQNISDKEWSEKMAECDKHPNKEDKLNAKDFARETFNSGQCIIDKSWHI